MTKIICSQCHNTVEPVTVSTGSRWVDPITGYAEDNFHDVYRCPVCGCEIPEEESPISPNLFDDVQF